MECKKCKKDSKVLCICGLCPKCNGMEEIKVLTSFEEFQKSFFKEGDSEIVVEIK